MRSVSNVVNVIESVEFMNKIFGDREFTSKEWKNAKSDGMCILDTLTDRFYYNGYHAIVEHTRTEEFSAEVIDEHNGTKTDFMINCCGERIMRKKDFDKLPLSVKNIMETTNGCPLRVKTFNIKTIEGIRYYYKLNIDTLKIYVEYALRNIDKAINETDMAISKLYEKRNSLIKLKEQI